MHSVLYQLALEADAMLLFQVNSCWGPLRARQVSQCTNAGKVTP